MTQETNCKHAICVKDNVTKKLKMHLIQPMEFLSLVGIINMLKAIQCNDKSK